MIIAIEKFGGIAPRVADPALLPTDKSQSAINVRVDRGGVMPLPEDMPVQDLPRDIMSMFRYWDGNFFTWTTDVDVVAAPVADDSHKRVYFAENGTLRVTDKLLYKQGGTLYPMASYKPSPPAPPAAPSVSSSSGADAVTALTISYATTAEANGTYDLIFSGGGGTGAAGTYTVFGGVITGVTLTAGGAYTSTPVVTTQSGAGVIIATGVRDATMIETRGYVYTYVNGYGSEGPPSLVSDLIDVYDGDEVTVAALETSVAADYYITKKRIYRLNQSSTGAQYQFVAEVGIAETNYADKVLSAELGELLASAEWDAAPDGIKGIIALPNGSLAGYVGNILCFSVPYYPHAWPVAYQKYVEYPIIALGSFGTTVAVLTSGTPYLAVGSHPANVVMEAMDLGHACMSKRGMVQYGDMVVYPAPEGLVAIGPNIREVLTAGALTRAEWNSRFNPSTITAFFWEGHYIGFYEIGGREEGFMFNLEMKELTGLASYATAGYRDPGTGILFLAEKA